MVEFTIFIFEPLGFLCEGTDEQVHSSEVKSSKYSDGDYHEGVGNCKNM